MIVNVASPTFDPCDSYGRLASELSAHLSQQGWHVNEFGNLARKRNLQITTGGFVLGYPTLFQQFGWMLTNGNRVAITMFESSILPDGWVAELNTCTAVIVPSVYCADVFRANGVNVPLHVIPLGVSDTFKRVTERPTDTPFTFLAIADRGYRKGWINAIQAFTAQFRHQEGVRLLLKAREGVFPANIGNTNIEVISEDYDEAQLDALYRQCHVMVYASHGEGFGLPPREFAATGGLSIVSNGTGLADDIERYAWAIPCTSETAWKHEKTEGLLGTWAKPDVQALSALMGQAWSQWYSPELTLFRKDAAKACHDLYEWATFTHQCVNVLEGAYAVN